MERRAQPAVRFKLLALLAASVTLTACGTAPRQEGTVVVAAPPAVASKAPRKSGCAAPGASIKRGGGYYQDDGPGCDIPENLDDIPDAVPRREPLVRAANKPYVALGREYVPSTEVKPYRARGVASWYGKKYHGQKTSIGDTYDMFSMTAAHTTLPLPSYVRVTSVANGKSVVVRVNDRGPFHADRLIDLSYTAAWKLGIIGSGSGEVEVEAILPGDELPAVAQSLPAAAPVRKPVTSEKDELAELELRLRSSERLSGEAAKGGSSTATSLAKGVFLQLGAFASLDNAEGLKNRLSRELDWLNEPIHIASGNGINRVQLGPYASRDEADKVAEKIRLALGFKPTTVVR